MSRIPKPLPDPLDVAPFRTGTALSAGVSRARLRTTDLDRPFVGVRSATPPTSPVELARAYGAILGDGEFFSHVTAAVLHRMWLPLEMAEQLALDVSVRKPLRAPRDRRVRGHHLIERPGLVWTVDGLPVSSPWETWAQLARVLSVTDLVVAGEALLAKDRPDRRRMLERLREVAADPDRSFHRRLARASLLLRVDSRSAGESHLRLILTRNGLPEPRINVRIHDSSGRFIGEGDLVYEEEQVLIEYEGDGHREKRQFRKDIGRTEDFIDAGWRVIRATGEDLHDPTRKVAIIRRALAELRRR